jgi:uncharacterized RDD family membrane protein YckC
MYPVTTYHPYNGKMNSIKAVAAKSEGDEKVRAGNYKGAVLCYQEAVRIDPSYLQAWNNLGYCYEKLGKTKEAKQVRDRLAEMKRGESVPDTARSDSQEDREVPLSRPGLFFASAWDRWFAYILDTVLVVIAFAVPAAFFVQAFQGGPGVVLILIPVFLVVYWTYFAVFEAAGHKGTFGKRAFKIYVTDDNGYRLSLPHSLERSFFKILFTLTPVSLLTLVNGLVIGSSAQSKGLHDYIANTLVVTKKHTEKEAFLDTSEKSAKTLLVIILAVFVLLGLVVLGAMVASFILTMGGTAP